MRLKQLFVYKGKDRQKVDNCNGSQKFWKVDNFGSQKSDGQVEFESVDD